MANTPMRLSTVQKAVIATRLSSAATALFAAADEIPVCSIHKQIRDFAHTLQSEADKFFNAIGKTPTADSKRRRG